MEETNAFAAADPTNDIDIEGLKELVQEDADEMDYQMVDFSGEDEDYDPTDISEPGSESEEGNPSIDLGFSTDEEGAYFAEDGAEGDDNFRDALREASNFKPKKAKKGMAALKSKMKREENLDPEVRYLLSQANEAFVRGDLQVALGLYNDVVKKDNKNYAAFKTCGEIYRQQGEINKCVNFWFIAAHLHPWDASFWSTVAELSYQLGHTRQAAYCYTRGIHSSNNKDLKAIFDRAILYRETGRLTRATDNFAQLLRTLPTDHSTIKELAMCYVAQNRVADAIKLYEGFLHTNMSVSPLPMDVPSFDWSELNILAELYGKQESWNLGTQLIKSVSRWIQGRQSQTFWDSVEEDGEFDDRRFSHRGWQNLTELQQSLSYELPIDIRIQLGLFRLNAGNSDEALIHFDFLFHGEGSLEGVADLYMEVGFALERCSLYKQALKFLTPITELDGYGDNENVISSMARCYRELEDYEMAKEAYKVLINLTQSEDAKLALTEIYFYLGDIESAYALEDAMDEFIVEEPPEKQERGPLQEGEAMIANIPEVRMREFKKVATDQEIRQMEKDSIARNLELYSRAMRLLPSIEEGDELAIKIFLEISGRLIDVLLTAKRYFSGDSKAKSSKSVYNRKKLDRMSLSEKRSRLRNLQQEIVLESHLPASLDDKSFRGLDFDTWYEVVVQHILIGAHRKQKEQKDQSYNLLDIALHTPIFNKSPEKHKLLLLTGLSVGCVFGDVESSLGFTRNLLNTFQFSSNMYRLFIASFQAGFKGSELFSDPANQKYFLRQVKALDAINTGKKITGMATVAVDQSQISKDLPLLHHVYASLLYEKKSYNSCLGYALQNYTKFNKDPTVVLTVALSHLHRAMQRLSNNRHFQILQGFTYMSEYVSIKLGKPDADVLDQMECDYNMGRAFHLFGLTSLAVEFYHKVLDSECDDAVYSLKADAAYNLTLIYNVGGNRQLARSIMMKYLTI